MTRRTNQTADKRWQANCDGGQNQRTSFFDPQHFANEPTFKKKTLLANGLR